MNVFDYIKQASINQAFKMVWYCVHSVNTSVTGFANICHWV